MFRCPCVGSRWICLWSGRGWPNDTRVKGAVLQWHLDRSGELDAILGAARVEDFTVDASDLSVPQAAAAVIRAWGDPVDRPRDGPQP